MSDSPMADKKQQPLELGSVNDGVSEKCQTQTEDPLSCLNQEESQIGVSEKCDIQMEDPLSCLNQEECQIGVSEKGDIQTEDPLSCLNHEQSSENGMKVEEFDSIVEEKMGRVSISGIEDERVVDQADVGNVSGSVVAAAAAMISKNEESDNKVVISSKVVERIVNDNGNGSIVSNSDTESESESEREASSSASSSDSDEDESSSNDEAEEEANMEEGEIVASDVDEMVGWDDDDEDTGVKGPIRSKNEVQVLPPVPEVTATLQPHHQMQPVGVVSSTIGAQVVVEGVEKHTPLCDGSILWITESRFPLGIVDEIFGPVKNPYYIVRYNSENEVPPGIHPGTLISFVPEFSSYILNDNSLYKKGYDASGENDEEASEDEFSDDEKEAEHRRMLKMKKRDVMNDQKPGNRKDKRNLKNRPQNWKHDQGVAADVQHKNGKLSVDQSPRFIPAAAAAAAPMDQGIHQSAPRQGHGQSIRPPSVPPFPHMQNSPGLASPSTGVWPNGFPFQQPQNMGFPNTLPNMGMSWPQQGHPQQMFQMPLPNALPFEQQINPALPPNFMFPGGLPNFGAGPPFGPWPAFGQNVFNQPGMPMGLPGQFTPAPMNLGGQVPANGPQLGQNNNSQPNAVVPGYINGSPNFNQGQSPSPMSIPGQFTPPPMNLGGQVPANGPQLGQNNNSQPNAVVPGYINGSPNFNQGQSPSPMSIPGQFTPPPMNLGGQVPENGPKSGQNNNNVSPNFTRGAHSGGGRRGNHRGGGRFGGRRGRSQCN
ncbi:H/ACA ribonucleoprotein complex non-core subunit NAF1 isoform X2 [Solanum lycopersicum]|nr:H/ACA ribonucleoprotein complex non-core subunit NAF1 isoform X2 [Solanum lycopersicum]